jgi:L-ribulose-5-phosphate 3-epimerase
MTSITKNQAQSKVVESRIGDPRLMKTLTGGIPMNENRRQFLLKAGAGLAVMGLSDSSSFFSSPAKGCRIGMCDWNLGPQCDPGQILKAKEAYLDGIQVSVGTGPNAMPLRQSTVREQYLRLGKQHGIAFCSVAAGLMNSIPLKSEPEAAIYVIDALEAAAALGAENILMAFFGKGDLRLEVGPEKYKDLSTGPFKEYELDKKGVDRVVAALKQIAPRAEALGVALGFENTLTARQNLEIIERVGSNRLQVYYDVGNSTAYGYDVPTELKLLGKDRICEIHLKDRKSPMLGSPEGQVRFQAVAQAVKDIDYSKWLVLETSGRKEHFLEDTRANVAFARKLFEIS